MGVMTAQPGEGPHPAGAPISDCYGGILLAQGILAALFARERTGEGQEVSTTLMDAMFPSQTEAITQYLTSGDLPSIGISPTHRFYEGIDGKWFALSVAFRSNPLKDLCDAIGLDDLSQDERFETQQKALEVNADALYAILKEHFLTRARDEWLKVLEEADFLVGPVYGYDEVFVDPQVVHNDMVLEFDHPRAGKVQTVNSPVKYSKTPTKLRIPPPLLGQHTDEILKELGYTSNQITELRGKKAVG
jgi:formyl-CoA transferase